MNRSLYSGVSGMKAHQTRMDVIGNNIANVNTYGFKASRVTFSDIYYQTVQAGSEGTSTSGGTNSGGIGYGTSVGSIDLLMGQSSFTMTDSTLDLAIDGEGFLQVQDADGNKYYTRAGALSFDSAGNLVDSSGNFVLGINGDPLGQTSEGNSLIQLSLPSVAASRSTGEEMINGKKFTLTTANTSDAGNISIQLIQGSGMTDGVKATAEVGTNGIVVTINPQETFMSMADLNTAINDAIDSYMESNVGASHPAGEFTLTLDNAEWPAEGITGEQICSTDYTLQDGTVDWPAGNIAGGFSPEGTTGSGFGAKFADPDNTTLEAFTVTYDADTNKFTVEATIGTIKYTGEITENKTEVGTMKLVNADGGSNSNDYIIFERPAFSTIKDAMTDAAAAADPGGATVDGDGKLEAGTWTPFATAGIDITADANKIAVTPAEESKCLGLSSTKFVLGGGTAGGAQGIESLTGVAIGADGTIVATHPQLGEVVVGQICLVTFANPEGLVQSSGTYFTEGANSGQMNYCQPGKGGSGQLVSGSLELSNVDLSKEFSDMITTQRGYQACSRLITVSDTMLEELVNLKR